MKKWLMNFIDEVMDFDTSWTHFCAVCVRIFILAWVVSVPFIWSIKNL